MESFDVAKITGSSRAEEEGFPECLGSRRTKLKAKTKSTAADIDSRYNCNARRKEAIWSQKACQ